MLFPDAPNIALISLSFAQKLLAQSGGNGMSQGHAILGANGVWRGCNGDMPKHEGSPQTHRIT